MATYSVCRTASPWAMGVSRSYDLALVGMPAPSRGMPGQFFVPRVELHLFYDTIVPAPRSAGTASGRS